MSLQFIAQIKINKADKTRQMKCRTAVTNVKLSFLNYEMFSYRSGQLFKTDPFKYPNIYTPILKMYSLKQHDATKTFLSLVLIMSTFLKVIINYKA